MSRVFITGSADGLGRMAAVLLAGQGHAVTLHARSDRRADDAWRAVPTAEAVLAGDLSTITGMRQVAKAANAAGRFDAVIHNAGIGYREPRRLLTEDGLEHVFAVNVLAPYLLTALIDPPARLVYLSSGMHRGGTADLSDPQWARRHWNGSQAWLAVSDEPAATVTGGYFYHQRPRTAHPAARDAAFQDELLDYCASLTGTTLPGG
jgi:NAD(P)-dependent dehydrogenase (short-subunit alcohol dehydrogenase family)